MGYRFGILYIDMVIYHMDMIVLDIDVGYGLRPTGLDLSILVTPRIDFGRFRPGQVGRFYATCRPDSARARIEFRRFRRFWATFGPAHRFSPKSGRPFRPDRPT